MWKNRTYEINLGILSYKLSTPPGKKLYIRYISTQVFQPNEPKSKEFHPEFCVSRCEDL